MMDLAGPRIRNSNLLLASRTSRNLYCCFVAGLGLFLSQTRSTGEALERFKLIVLAYLLAIVGATIAVLAVAALVVLYLWERKRHFEHL
jgi:hypothetical protein